MGSSNDSTLPVTTYWRTKDMNYVRVPTVVLVLELRLRTRRMRSPWKSELFGLLIWSAVSMPLRGRRRSSGYLNSVGASTQSQIEFFSCQGANSGPEREREVHSRSAHSMRIDQHRTKAQNVANHVLDLSLYNSTTQRSRV
jgi:hypothetical protein